MLGEGNKRGTHLIENCYFNVRNVTIKQAIGIPMEIDPEPFSANLFFIFIQRKTHVITNFF